MRLQRKNDPKENNRWKWMAGATAATAAGVSASHANLVTINLTNNYISGFDGNHLNADLTGDGHPDLTIANAFYSRRVHTSYGHTLTGFTQSSVGINLNGVRAAAFFSHDYNFGYVTLGSKNGHFYHSSGTRYLNGSIPIFFKDLRINGGAPTSGLLEVTVSPNEVQLDSFTYTSNTPVAGSSRTVPDQGSSLALLAMGAGGVLALRRWRADQAGRKTMI